MIEILEYYLFTKRCSLISIFIVILQSSMPFTVITLLRTFSCCLALLLPLIDLQQEIRGMTGKNVVKQQLKAASVDVP